MSFSTKPIVKIEIICPDENIGDLMSLCDGRRGVFQTQQFISEGRQMRPASEWWRLTAETHGGPGSAATVTVSGTGRRPSPEQAPRPAVARTTITASMRGMKFPG